MKLLEMTRLGWLAAAVVLSSVGSVGAQSSVALSNTSHYVGDDRWDWTVFVQGTPTALARIKCVEYTLHPTFPNPVRLVCDRGKGTQAFALSSNGWGEFTIAARVIRQDGGVQALSYRLRLQPAVSEAARASAPARPQPAAIAAPRQQAPAAARTQAITPQGVSAGEPSCATLVTLAARHGSVVRVGQSVPPLFAYAEQTNDNGLLRLYLITTSKAGLVQTGLQDKDLLAMLAKLGVQPSSSLTAETYVALTLKPGQSTPIPMKGRTVVTATNASGRGSVDLAFCGQN